MTEATAREVLDAATLEGDWQKTVTDWATLRGWLWYHVTDSRKDPAGFPDLVLVRLSRVIFAELKKQSGRVSAKQALWLDRLQGTYKVEVYLWRPADWLKVKELLQ